MSLEQYAVGFKDIKQKGDNYQLLATREFLRAINLYMQITIQASHFLQCALIGPFLSVLVGFVLLDL